MVLEPMLFFAMSFTEGQKKFCFKIYVSDNDKRRDLRDTWHKRVIESCARVGLKAKRPDRFGNGYCMTVAVLDQEY